MLSAIAAEVCRGRSSSALGSEGPNPKDQKKDHGALLSTQQQRRTGRGGQAKRPGRPTPCHVQGGADANESARNEELPTPTTA